MAYNVLSMRLTMHTLKAALATAISLWLAVLACVMGCTQPALANSQSAAAASSPQENFVGHHHFGLMADMESCHHSDGNSSAPPGDRKSPSNGALSCCPLEITLAPKWSALKQGIAPGPDFVPPSGFHFEIARFSSPAEFAPPLSHNGRDTLLESHLLRI
jgi:hypothetical protein